MNRRRNDASGLSRPARPARIVDRVRAWLGMVLISGTACGHGMLHERIETLSGRIAAAPNASLYLQRGELHRVHEDYAAALADYQRAERLDPDLDLVFLHRGQALLESGQPAPARVALDEYIRRCPDDAPAHLVLARVLAALGESQLAIERYDHGIALHPEPLPEHFLERAELLGSLGEWAAALHGLDAGIHLLGPIPSFQMPAVELELKLERYDAAIARIDLLMTRAQRREQWLTQRAEILVQAGRKPEAKRDAGSALALIENLPVRLRQLPATRTLEERARKILQQLGPVETTRASLHEINNRLH